MAMAHHHLGQVEEARREYDRAVAEMQKAEGSDSELESLRRAAARLLAEDVGPNND